MKVVKLQSSYLSEKVARYATSYYQKVTSYIYIFIIIIISFLQLTLQIIIANEEL